MINTRFRMSFLTLAQISYVSLVCTSFSLSRTVDVRELGHPFGNANAIHDTVVRTRRRNVQGERLRGTVGGAAREQSMDGMERRKKKEKKKKVEEGEEEGPAFSEIIVLAISVSRRQRTRFICRVYCR
ncbi:hypothetical protein P5V15_005930 [Pogonomyrmex californicus]